MNLLKGNILLPLTSVIAIIAIVAAGYFYWQNRKLEERTNIIAPSITTYPTKNPKDMTSFTFRENPVSFQYPSGITLTYFPTENGGKMEPDRVASGENAILKNGAAKIMGIVPDQLGIGGIPDPGGKIEHITVDGHKGTKNVDSKGTYFVMIPYENKNLMASCFAEVTICDQIVSSFKFQQQASEKSGNSGLNFQIPSNWQRYDNKFQDIIFRFSYPNGLIISDDDQDSGNISIYKSLYDVTPAVSIGRLSYYGLPEYSVGGRREWFLNALSKQLNTPIASNELSFTPVTFNSGNQFYLVKVINDDPNKNYGLVSPSYGEGKDFYFGILGGKAILVNDFKLLPKEDVYRIMQSLSVSN